MSAVGLAMACWIAASAAESKFGIPNGLLSAIVTVESAGAVYTVRSDSVRVQAATLPEAERAAGLSLSRGEAPDLGCFQLNARWHGGAFGTIGAMFSPDLQAGYVARWLLQMRRQTDSWTEAVRRYHSADPLRGQAYACRVAAAWQSKEWKSCG